MKFDAAITYAERHTLHVLSVFVDGALAVARTAPGWDLSQPHALYSGTKSFWGVAAAAACDDGLLELDEPASTTIVEWAADPRKRRLTLRQLLDLTSGYGFGGLGNAVPTAAQAIAKSLKDEPGTSFTYGGVPLQVFGEVLRRKVAPAYASAHAYLQGRVLNRIGMSVDRWRTLRDGSQPLPTGAFVSANEWLKFGSLLCAGGSGVILPTSFAQCITPSAANPKYGLGLWLELRDGQTTALYASGAGGQGLYVLPKQRIVAVHFGQSPSWKHAAFIARLAADGS